MMKPSGFQAILPIFSPSIGLHDHGLEDHGRADEGQQDAQHQREIAGAHAGALTNLVVGGAYGKGDPTTTNTRPEKKSF
jgi:hypothetical protein